MKNLISAVIMSILFASPAFAGGGHEHSQDGGHSHGTISSAAVIAKADKKVQQLIKSGKIDKNWAGKKASVKKKQFKNGMEWVVSYKNAAMKDAEKQDLYLFYTLSGRYIAANYSGK